jgi:hypothetical protein
VPFQIKDFASIVASQINHARAATDKITDFMPGSVARTLMEAPAVEIEELYMQMFLGLRDAIPVATFLSFGFGKLPASVAHGWVTVSNADAPSEDLIVPSGTAFTAADGRVYTTTEAVTWEAGKHAARFPVAYGSPGLAGNIASGLITSSSFFDGSHTISNAAIETGRDGESDPEREARFSDFIASLSRGTVAACEYAARQSVVLDEDGNRYEYVTRAGLSEAPGYVRIYIYSSRGHASVELLNSGQRLIDGWRDPVTGAITPGYRAGGVRMDVLRMVERAITLSIAVEMFPGYALNDDVKRRLDDVFSDAIRSVQPETTLLLGELVELLLTVPGVRKIAPGTNENIRCAVHEALVPGALTISGL